MTMATVVLIDPILGIELEYDQEIAPLVQAIQDFGGFIIEVRKTPRAAGGFCWSLEFSKLNAMNRLIRAIRATEPEILPQIRVGAGLVESGKRYTTIAISLVIGSEVLDKATGAARTLRKTGFPKLTVVEGRGR